jgi:pimeloyl-ACP methyl ester carboxylesterase
LVWRRHRHLVDGLVLCATAADFTSPHVDDRLLRVAGEMWRATGPLRRSTHLGKQVVSHLLEVAPIGNQFVEALARHDDDAIHGAGLAIGRFCSTEWITGVDVPVVVIVTTRDRLVRPAHQWQLAALVPRARTITVDAGHFAPFRQPELIAGAVTASCDSITQPSFGNRWRRAARNARRLLAQRRRSWREPSVSVASRQH